MKKSTYLMCLCCLACLLHSPVFIFGQKAATNQTNYALMPKLPRPPKPEPFKVSTIPLPESVLDAVLVNYLPDAQHLIMEVTIAGAKKSNLAIMKDDGTGFKCLTCELPENIGGEMPVPLPDGKRVYTPTGILECSPSIVDCKQARILPLVYPTVPGGKTIARIASNMSQDGVHVAYTLLVARPTPSALVLVSELTRVSDEKGERYELAKTKVISGDKAALPGAPDFRPFFFGGGEVKSFTGMGKYLTTISAFEAGNFDIAKIDLTTGEVTRFTRHFSYDEGVYPSPDGKWLIFQSHRHTTRMDAFSLIPRPLIVNNALAPGVAEWRNEEVEGFRDARRYYGLTMTDQYGDRARLPEDGYTGQNLTTASDNLTKYNHFGNLTWHPSSTRGIFWEQKDPRKVKKGEAMGRLRIITFTSRKPTVPLKIVTPTMDWATNLEDLKPLNSSQPTEGKLVGLVSGHANISTQKAESPSGETVFKIEYVNFSDDGQYVLNGSETIGQKTFWEATWNADITVSGKHKGFLKVENAKFSGRSHGSGIIKTQLDNRKIEVDLSKGLPTGVPGELR
ncbi:hypothetical protein J2Y45_002984 [Dyadobacter sp. BE34]|uniref:WD40 domain protein beta Propeller n=1 Tax=Dyadobacter fermentans TaxID=94254 RepID=A0ABU1QU78_9BACT|nr:MULTISPECIES: hypothetical protein [Dyadobacter]MDR6804708.1 hypothetical protein [Dyadobacter fermentans]MDR7043533.1 hypothetical protein [Dyadobacter sp. BE242]MDR7197845.1 hypothetical protein [Dyadobacter sp. BE34]MDR7214722.1 hypothetical protein [Dyadobacter sp. BE31]MDR7262257.1 hypothetical protein [Dyadobacter sp. BE32]